MPLSLTHVVRKPRIAEADRPPLLLLLHGVGSNEQDLFGLAPQLDPRFLVVSARAPITLQPGSYAWFHVQFTPGGPVIDAEEAEQSRQLLLRFVDEAVDAHGADPSRVFLMGFSQGCIMSLYAALTEPERFRGIVGMSGRLLPEAIPKLASAERLRGLPLLVVHGTQDAVLPVSYGRDIRGRLSELPVRLDYREYAIGHWVTEETMAAVRTWLASELDAGSEPIGQDTR